MSQFITLDDELFTKLKKVADKNGLTPEAWLTNVVMNDRKSPETSKIVDEEQKKLHASDERHREF